MAAESIKRQAERQVDHHALRANQISTITLLALSFVLNLPVLAAFTAAVMLISAAYPPYGVFTRVYRLLLKAGIVRPHAIPDNPEPHRFAQGMGGSMVALGVVALVAGVGVLGWALVGVVIALSSLNLFAGWCAGCMIYYWLNRMGVPGFNRSRSEVMQ